MLKLFFLYNRITPYLLSLIMQVKVLLCCTYYQVLFSLFKNLSLAITSLFQFRFFLWVKSSRMISFSNHSLNSISFFGSIFFLISLSMFDSTSFFFLRCIYIFAILILGNSFFFKINLNFLANPTQAFITISDHLDIQ